MKYKNGTSYLNTQTDITRHGTHRHACHNWDSIGHSTYSNAYRCVDCSREIVERFGRVPIRMRLKDNYWQPVNPIDKNLMVLETP